MAVRKRKATKRKATKRAPAKKKTTRRKKSYSAKNNVVNFNKYMENKKVLKGLREQVVKEFKSDSIEIVKLKKLLKNGHKKAA